ncbi:MAG: metal-dependent phosphohydrolase [Desulfurivibrio sp.]|nr:metal-dependent phosphohydrolase [Desulfurivibrio sp.]
MQDSVSSFSSPALPIDHLIAVVENGGRIRTGVDVFNNRGRLLLEKNVLVADAAILHKVKRQGAAMVPIVEQQAGGMWDSQGRRISLPATRERVMQGPAPGNGEKLSGGAARHDIERRIDEIVAVKKAAARKYEQAKGCIRQALDSIHATGGEFDMEPVAATVGELVDFVTTSESAFAYLTREIFSYDDYLYNHSINVCTIGTVVMQKFNSSFSAAVNRFLNDEASGKPGTVQADQQSFVYYTPSELLDISIGYFMHDLGKVLVAPEILNKKGKLTQTEFTEVKTHVTSKAERIMRQNRLRDPHLVNVCLYHHAALYEGEQRCYPELDHRLVPAYVKVCKLADIYDAMTSKRCYKDALNPVGVVTDIFHHYAGKDPLLQYVLYSFIKSVGIYPAGSVVTLTNGQLAYVLDSRGPMLLPITTPTGEPVAQEPEIVEMSQR